MVEWVVLLVALVALGLSIAAVAKPCSSNFGDFDCDGSHGNAIKGGDCVTPNSTQGDMCGRDNNYICGKNLTCSNERKCIKGKEESCKPFPEGNCFNNIPHPKPINCKKLNPIECEKHIQCQINSDTGKCQMVNDNDICGDIYCHHDMECKPCGSNYFCVANECVQKSPDPHPSEDPCCNKNFICRYDSDCNDHLCGHCVNEREGMKGYCSGPYSKKPFDPKCNSGKNSKSGGGGLPPLDKIGGGPGSTYDPTGSGNGFQGGGTPSPPSSPSPSPGGGGKKSSDLPLILGLSGGGLVIVLAIAFLLMKRK